MMNIVILVSMKIDISKNRKKIRKPRGGYAGVRFQYPQKRNANVAVRRSVFLTEISACRVLEGGATLKQR
jgi:hypothetical protein